MKHWQLKRQVLNINQVLRICDAGGKSAHANAKFHPSSWPEFILNSIFITRRQILSLEKFRLNKRAVGPFQSMSFFDNGRFHLEKHQVVFKKLDALTLCGAHGRQGSRRQQAHLAQFYWMLSVQSLTFGRRWRRTLEKTTGGLWTIQIT